MNSNERSEEIVAVLRQALEALEDMHIVELAIEDLQSWNKAVKSLRQAIAVAEQHNAASKLPEEEKQSTKCVTSVSEVEPVAWATREDFYRELDRSVNRMRQQMEIKAVLMRCTNYDLALPIIDVREGHVLVGQVTQPKREWVGLTNDQKLSLEIQGGKTDVMLAEMVEKWLKEMNT
jgi:hypothetical protein